ncbi:MAG: hypothetical protein M1814_002623 [Vezdaea aestivalis]|nr:MAG: hypothetical protein M1814_002623 [Vezdaea aestivalis]
MAGSESSREAIPTSSIGSIGSIAESKTTLLDKARLFLQNDDIRNAPDTRKIAFLKEKGLREEDIGFLVSKKDPKDSSPKDQKSSNENNLKEVKSSDAPPIITYPEYLTRRAPVPPLITIQRIISTLYITGGATAAVALASQYLVNPMIEQLGVARHSLAENTISGLATLIDKLEDAASQTPSKEGHLARRSVDRAAGSVTSVDSDPTELFHVDAGTQTSPGHSRRSSMVTDETTPLRKKSGMDLVDGENSRLESLQRQLESTQADCERYSLQTLDGSLSELTAYLEGLTFSNTYYSTGGHNVTRMKSSVSESDAILQVKREIRGIKGTLLSAKNFPSATSAGSRASNR